MKMRPLPDLDLARIAPLPKHLQRAQLEQIRYGRPPFSYAPLRACFHDIFNVQPEMFGPVAPTPWSAIETQLRRKCRPDEELQANLAVARGLHGFVTEANMLGREYDFLPLAIGSGRKVSYWLPLVLSHENRPSVPFIDPRRSRGLTREARRFVFSMMHERIRAADPDFETIRFTIVQFGDVIKDPIGDLRRPVLYTDDDVPPLSLSELEAMVSTTYGLWRDVCEERDVEARRKASGTHGPLI